MSLYGDLAAAVPRVKLAPTAIEVEWKERHPEACPAIDWNDAVARPPGRRFHPKARLRPAGHTARFRREEYRPSRAQAQIARPDRRCADVRGAPGGPARLVD